MTYVANWFGIADDSQYVLTVERDPEPTDAAQNGIYLSPDGELVCTQDAVESTDQYQRGLRVTLEGALRIFLVNGSAPAGSAHSNGFLCTQSGQLCVTTDAPVYYVNGVPLNVYGAVCIIGGTPPEPVLFDTLVFYNEGIEPSIWVTQLRFGISGSNSGWYTVEATFDADHPGLPVEDFLTPTPPVSPAPSTYPGFTITTAAGNDIVDMSSLGWLHSAAPIYIQIVFDDPIDSVGFIYETDGEPFASVLIYNGATLLASNTIGFSGFLGYSTAGSVITPDNRITADGDTRVTADGDTRVWV